MGHELSEEEKDRLRVSSVRYLIGPGELYGGDYCLYKGVNTPDDAHSIATIRINFSNKMKAKDLIAFSRVQNQVKKPHNLSFFLSSCKFHFKLFSPGF
jgi:tRNA splicing endonuclease